MNVVMARGGRIFEGFVAFAFIRIGESPGMTAQDDNQRRTSRTCRSGANSIRSRHQPFSGEGREVRRLLLSAEEIQALLVWVLIGRHVLAVFRRSEESSLRVGRRVAVADRLCCDAFAHLYRTYRRQITPPCHNRPLRDRLEHIPIAHAPGSSID